MQAFFVSRLLADYREIKIQVYTKLQSNVNLYHVSKFSLFFVYCLLLLHNNKWFYASFIHKNRSGLFLSAYFLFWEILHWRLTFAVNVNLNLSNFSFLNHPKP